MLISVVMLFLTNSTLAMAEPEKALYRYASLSLELATQAAQGTIIGGIGISGAPPGKSEKDNIDGACAKAGFDAIEKQLEFAEM